MNSKRIIRRCLVLMALVCPALSASAITVKLDYTYDSTNFFGAGNPQGAAAGQQAKITLEAAATFFSNIVTDSLSVVQTPPPFHSQTFDGSATWEWTASFSNPATGTTDTLTNPTILANQYLIFAGARPLSGSEAGRGGPGGYGFSYDPMGFFTPEEGDQLDQIENEFENEVQHRDKPSGFADWGGSVAFSTSTTWHFDYTTSPVVGELDFYSVALHELGHTLGLGTADQWNALVSGGTFIGAASEAQNGGPVMLSPDLGHWKEGTQSKIDGTTITQEACMDPTLTVGTRKKFTTLDAAALTDIGWTIVAPTVPTGDYNGNGIVDAADYTIWRDTLGSTTDLRANGNNTGASAGKIDQADYLVWKSNFGHSAGAGAAAAVPEPTSWLLLSLGACLARASIRGRERESHNCARG
jgi:hypothetical protein